MQALSKAEGGNKGELDSLEAEADMPLEQLLAQYGYVMGCHEDAPQGGEDAPGPSHQQSKQKAQPETDTKPAERPAKRRKTSQSSSLSGKDSGSQMHSAAQHSGAGDSESDDGSADLRTLMEDSDSDKAADEVRAAKGKAVRSSPEMTPHADTDRPRTEQSLPDKDIDELDSGHSESEDFDSAAGSDAGEDDEQTLEEEERMVQAEGAVQPVSLLACLFALELVDICHALSCSQAFSQSAYVTVSILPDCLLPCFFSIPKSLNWKHLIHRQLFRQHGSCTATDNPYHSQTIHSPYHTQLACMSILDTAHYLQNACGAIHHFSHSAWFAV